MTASHEPRRTVRLPFEPPGRCPDCGAAVDGPAGAACPDPACALARAARARQAVHDARRSRVEAALRDRGLDPSRIPWSTTPFNPAAMVPLEAAVREDFLHRLRAIVEEADRAPEGGGPRPSPGDDAPPDPGGVALAAACAGCRGACCRRGGSHAAHLRPDTVRRVWAERPGLTPEATVDLYASHLGALHAEGGCVFHDDAGCRLPRSLRSDTCNDWFCGELDEVRRRWAGPDGVPARHAFVALGSGHDAVRSVREVEP